MQAAVYSRKSRITGTGESIENQAELCRQYVLSHFGETVSRALLYFEDEGFSGGNLNRPEFAKMMRLIRQKKIQVLICYRLDRISRSINDFTNLMQELDRLGVTFISIREQFDTHTPMGRAMMYIASVFSQLERETIAERIRDNMHELAKDGRWMGGKCPYGYSSKRLTQIVGEKKHSRSVLCINPEETKIVKYIYGEYIRQPNLALLSRRLREKELYLDNRPFTTDSIRRILLNPIYAAADPALWEYLLEKGATPATSPDSSIPCHGVMVYNKTRQEAGRANQKKPVEDWIIAVGSHEAVISGKDWVLVHRLFETRKRKSG